jgi:hypothetical protein
VPSDAQAHPRAYFEHFAQAAKHAFAAGGFRGRRVAIALPAWLTHTCHVRVPDRGADALHEAVTEEARGKFPIDPHDAVLRFMPAGDVFVEQETRREMIVSAIAKQDLAALLDACNRARLDVAAIAAPARALLDCFANIYRRKADADAVSLLVDFGSAGTRAIVTHGAAMRFCRAIAPGASLVDELELCRRYHELNFPQQPVERLIFAGGGARDVSRCQDIAQHMALKAQVGDPLVRFNRTLMPQLDCLDRRSTQPDWAACVGLSLGPAPVPA